MQVFQQLFVTFVRCNFMFWCTLGIVGAEQMRRQIFKLQTECKARKKFVITCLKKLNVSLKQKVLDYWNKGLCKCVCRLRK